MILSTKISKYLSLVKFSHTVFAMPFALIGYFSAIWLSPAVFEWHTIGLVVLCMIFARNAAMAFNRYIDREIDGKNPRTANRDIPTGNVRTRSALIFVILNSIMFMTATWFINSLVFYLSPVALFVILGYSYTKQFTSFCHFVLGLGLSLAPIGAWLAVTGEFSLLPVSWSLSVLFWVSGFDIIYALQDEDFDRREKLSSIPASVGRNNALLIARLIHLCSVGFIVFAGFLFHSGSLYWVGVGIFISLLIYQHSIVKAGDLSRVNLAFFTTNGLASIIFSIFVISDLYI